MSEDKEPNNPNAAPPPGGVTLTPNMVPAAEVGNQKKPAHKLAEKVALYLEQGDSIIYAIVGICFILAAVIALGYAFWDFADKVSQVGSTHDTSQNPGIIASAIIKLVSDLLLVIIILEVLGTIIQYLRFHVTSLTPFLFIGIISATRGILSIGARLSVQSVSLPDQEFVSAMIELGVNAGVIVGLGLTLRLLGKRVTD